MRVEKVILRKLKMKLKKPFQPSFGTQYDKTFIIVELHTKDHVAYGDCPAFEKPFYNEETTTTAWHMLQDFLIPLLFSKDDIAHPSELTKLFDPVRRNNMAKASLDCAMWDLYAKENNISLSKALGGTRDKIETGVSIGIQESPEELLKVVEQHLSEGYRRIKIKIKPGKDLKYIEAVRKRFGDIMFTVDANSAYTLADIDVFKEMDQYNLLLIEQPLACDDIVDHAKLQAALKTRICLDESIHSAEDARKAIELGSMRTINIKVGRVGGFTEAKKIHDICQAHDIPVWCGGMLDTGIGRAQNIAIASLPNYKFPGDIPESTRYWHQDFTTPVVTIDKNAMIQVPHEPGLGFKPIPELMDQFTFEKKEIVR